MDPVQILRSVGGVALTRTVVAKGAGETAIRSAVRNGAVVRLERGLRPAAVPDYWQSNGKRTHSCVSHRTALTHPDVGGAVAALPDVLLHALLCLPPLESLVMVESAHNRGDIDLTYRGDRPRGFPARRFPDRRIDGLAFNLSSRQFKKDRRRDNMAVVQGFPVLRFFYDDIVFAPEAVLAQVREVLARGSLWRPQPKRPGFEAAEPRTWR
jgi:hypothetical protein